MKQLLCLLTLLAEACSAEPPNIVLILVDDLGYADVGYNGCTDIPTPNIDSIAANGVICEQGYVCAPVCAPFSSTSPSQPRTFRLKPNRKTSSHFLPYR